MSERCADQTLTVKRRSSTFMMGACTSKTIQSISSTKPITHPTPSRTPRIFRRQVVLRGRPAVMDRRELEEQEYRRKDEDHATPWILVRPGMASPLTFGQSASATPMRVPVSRSR